MTLSCPLAKGWKARENAPRRATHPGTAVAWQGLVFEVVEIRPLPDGGVSYSLEPWREDLAVRSLDRYDEASEVGRASEHAWRASSIRNRRVALLLSPLLGHLPGDVQARMEQEFGAPATAMTVVSALPLLAVGVVGMIGVFVGMAGGSIAPLPQPPAALSVYLFGESAMRLSVVAGQSRPAGSIPGVLLYELGVRIVRAFERGRRISPGGFR